MDKSETRALMMIGEEQKRCAGCQDDNGGRLVYAKDNRSEGVHVSLGLCLYGDDQ
jgi:hypothetical protein